MASATRPRGPRSGHLPVNTNNPPRAGPEGSSFPASPDSRPSCPPRRPGARAGGGGGTAAAGPEDAPRTPPRVPHRSRVRTRTCQSLLSSGAAGGRTAPRPMRRRPRPPPARPHRVPPRRQLRRGAGVGAARSPARGTPGPQAAPPGTRRGRAIWSRRLPSPAGPGPGTHAGLGAEAGAGAGRSRSPPRTQSDSAGARLTCSTGRRGPSRTIGPLAGARVTAQASRCRPAPPPPPPFPPARRRLVPAVRLLHSPGPGAAYAAPRLRLDPSRRRLRRLRRARLARSPRTARGNGAQALGESHPRPHRPFRAPTLRSPCSPGAGMRPLRSRETADAGGGSQAAFAALRREWTREIHCLWPAAFTAVLGPRAESAGRPLSSAEPPGSRNSSASIVAPLARTAP
ncbi:uncharacterized protein LOC114204776 [Eumetopias jubatus]|uniref:uncharacterized protein LOC114204776 n=1 Tax=Eumetopias jubatus TaxID=34886 RepID=UPI001016A51B|nr:uncharacterized protein LOC114204776 [Eumetopias jubatus]